MSLSRLPSICVNSSSVSLPHCVFALPVACFHLPFTISQFIAWSFPLVRCRKWIDNALAAARFPFADACAGGRGFPQGWAGTERRQRGYARVELRVFAQAEAAHGTIMQGQTDDTRSPEPLPPRRRVPVWQQVLIWVSVLLAFLIVMWLLSGILLPFLVGAGVAYFLDPLVGRLHRWGVPRVLAAGLTIALLLGL